MTCPKCGKPCVGKQHYECPRPDMKPLSRESHDEREEEIRLMEAACNRELVSNIPTEGFVQVWQAVLAGQLPLSELSDALYTIGVQTGHGSISGVEYKTMRNQLEEMGRKNDVKLRMTALSMGEKKSPRKKLGVADLRARESRA